MPFAWTDADDAALKQAIEANVSINRLVARLNRSKSGIRSRARELGLKIVHMERLPLKDRRY